MTKRGPKTEPGAGDVQRTQVMLDPASREQLLVVGDGNLSRGVRHAARVAYEAYQRSPGPESTYRGQR